MMKRILTIFAALCVGLAVFAVTPREEIAADNNCSASNHFDYPYPARQLPRLTPAPRGYEAFYIDHYGRHGSRWLTTGRTYTEPVAQLAKAERNGKLTAKGEQLLTILRKVAEASTGRIGDLTDVGAQQHHGIAARMYSNFPTVFAGDARVDARSTMVLRCILSMVNETNELCAHNPRLRITTDASMSDMHYLGWGHGEDTCANRLRQSMYRLTDSINAADTHPERFISSIITDDSFVTDSLNAKKLMRDVFDVAGSIQDVGALRSINLYDYFTPDEIYNLWKMKNIYWYVQWSNNPQGGNRMPFIERELLHNMIQSADDAIAKGERGATLRFGHETCLLPLACLMELDSVNYSCSNLNELADHWQDYRIFPMACNIQMIFYHKKVSKDILVKVLLNEHEATLPVKTDCAPYYHWNALKVYYEKKLATKISWN
jgi:hypothetical protein